MGDAVKEEARAEQCEKKVGLEKHVAQQYRKCIPTKGKQMMGEIPIHLQKVVHQSAEKIRGHQYLS